MHVAICNKARRRDYSGRDWRFESNIYVLMNRWGVTIFSLSVTAKMALKYSVRDSRLKNKTRSFRDIKHFEFIFD